MGQVESIYIILDTLGFIEWEIKKYRWQSRHKWYKIMENSQSPKQENYSL